MKPICMPSTTLLEFDCRIEVLMQTPDAVSAEDGFYPRRNADCRMQRSAPAPFFRDQDEELALRIEAFRQSPHVPGISWMYRA